MNNNCSQKNHHNGRVVFATHTILYNDVEIWVNAISKESGQVIYCDYFKNFIRVLVIGDIFKVRNIIYQSRLMHDTAFYKAARSLVDFFDNDDIIDLLDNIWEYNKITYLK